jgi:hypothetical protein
MSPRSLWINAIAVRSLRGILLFVLITVWSAGALADASVSQSIRFADQSPLSKTLDPYQSPQHFNVSVAIIDDGGPVNGLQFKAKVTDPAGQEVETVVVTSNRNSISQLGTQWFHLNFVLKTPLKKPEDTLSGVLEISGTGIVPATRPLELQADRTLAAYEGTPITGGLVWLLEGLQLHSLSTSIVVIAFFVALVFMLVLVRTRVWAALWSTTGQFRSYLAETPGWDFSSGWASTLTATGAILGTLLAAGIVPDEPVTLSKQGFAGLNLFFGALILIGPFIYKAIHPPDPNGSTPPPAASQIELGYSLLFLLASFFTFWAVLGEMSTIFFLLLEITKGAMTTLMVWVFRLFLLGVVVGLAVYTWVTVPRLLLPHIRTKLEVQHDEAKAAEEAQRVTMTREATAVQAAAQLQTAAQAAVTKAPAALSPAQAAAAAAAQEAVRKVQAAAAQPTEPAAQAAAVAAAQDALTKAVKAAVQTTGPEAQAVVNAAAATVQATAAVQGALPHAPRRKLHWL